MKVQLIGIVTDGHTDVVGRCSWLMRVDGERFDIDGYDWSWGHYSDYIITQVNALDFADYLNNHEFDLGADVEIKDNLYSLVVDYYYNRDDANEFVIKH